MRIFLFLNRFVQNTLQTFSAAFTEKVSKSLSTVKVQSVSVNSFLPEYLIFERDFLYFIIVKKTTDIVVMKSC